MERAKIKLRLAFFLETCYIKIHTGIYCVDFIFYSIIILSSVLTNIPISLQIVTIQTSCSVIRFAIHTNRLTGDFSLAKDTKAVWTVTTIFQKGVIIWIINISKLLR